MMALDSSRRVVRGGSRRNSSGMRRGRRRCVFFSVIAASVVATWRIMSWSAPKEEPPPVIQSPPPITFGAMGYDFNVKTNGIRPAEDTFHKVRRARGSEALATPEPWDSNLCMSHWQRTELLTEVDPTGYVVFVNGMEQLGGNKYLLADGAFIAKSLNRTLVEFPVRDARISVANATLGLGSYWDMSAICMHHRVLDQVAFRGLVGRGDISPESFVSIYAGNRPSLVRNLKDPDDVRSFFMEFAEYKVIVMDHAWKSRRNRDVLGYLRPNPFFMGLVRMLLEENERDWAEGSFLSVQWRTETATGNLTECYDVVRDAIEEERRKQGLSRDQVLVTTDMFGTTSGTYKEYKKAKIRGGVLDQIREDYPKALDNGLHRFFERIEDSGVKAIVSGLVVAYSSGMIASSLNAPWTKVLPKASVCQKPYSGYISLITEWRSQLYRKDPDTIIRLFPFGDEEGESSLEHDGAAKGPVKAVGKHR